MNKIIEKIKKEINLAYEGLDEYAETLEDTYVCSRHLDKALKLLEKLERDEK